MASKNYNFVKYTKNRDHLNKIFAEKASQAFFQVA